MRSGTQLKAHFVLIISLAQTQPPWKLGFLRMNLGGGATKFQFRAYNSSLYYHFTRKYVYLIMTFDSEKEF